MQGPILVPLHWAAANAKWEFVRLLMVNSGGRWSVYARNRNGETPLHKAAAVGNVDTIRFLVKERLDVSDIDDRGETRESDTSERDNRGETPLHHAARNGQIEAVRCLVKELGADVNAEDRKGETPLRKALKKKHTETARVLMEADLHVRLGWGGRL